VSTGFLDICGTLAQEAGGVGVVRATADVRPFHYSDSQNVLAPFLVLEGLNQFGVRLGRRALGIPCDSPERVVPACVRRFDCPGAIDRAVYRARGDASPFGDSAIAAVWLESDRGTVASAEVVAARWRREPPNGGCALQGDRTRDCNAGENLFHGASSAGLFTLRSHVRDVPSNSETFEFAIRGETALLAEHFPSHAIVPGSLLLEFMWRLCVGDEKCADVQIQHAQFLKPVLPSEVYRYTIRRHLGGPRHAQCRVGNAEDEFVVRAGFAW
jgi:3-hydroxymyristoyl/3-hydroxydecanoyl-(acyl carrier protein) dehydratase